MSPGGYRNARVVRSGWLEQGGRRLDCNPYMSGALEARDILRQLKVRKDALHTLTAGYAGGIYNGPMFSRIWVDDPQYGVPFIGSSDISLADLSKLPLLKRSYAQSKKLEHLKLAEGTTLITCSGTIGRMAYVRPDMAGIWSSQHVMKVVPDPGRIPPGYLYAFLSSRYGVPLVVAGTYGAIIQHIEPQHIAGLPVPRFDADFEAEIHQLIELSAMNRTAAQEQLTNALRRLEEDAGFNSKRLKQVTAFSTTSISYSELNGRLDAPYHSAAALLAETLLETSTFGAKPLPEVVKRYFKPPIFKRLWVNSAKFGRLFVSGNDIYRYQPEDPRYVSLRTPRFEEFILERGTVAFQAAGQIYGLFARPLYINGWLEGVFCADDVFRIVPYNEVDGAFLYLFLRTGVGEALIKRQACGNSIPRVWEPHMSKLRVLWPRPEVRARYAIPVIEAYERIEEARHAEMKAIAMIERKIQEDS